MSENPVLDFGDVLDEAVRRVERKAGADPKLWVELPPYTPLEEVVRAACRVALEQAAQIVENHKVVTQWIEGYASAGRDPSPLEMAHELRRHIAFNAEPPQ